MGIAVEQSDLPESGKAGCGERIGTSRRRPLFSAIFRSQYLPATLEAELVEKSESEMRDLLPILGPLLGVGVLLFALWDYLIDASGAPHALTVRLLFVLAGLACCDPRVLPLGITTRGRLVYWSYSFAVIVSSAMLDKGLVYGLPGITACIFTLPVIAVRLGKLLYLAAPPMLLFILLSAQSLPMHAFLNGAALYFMSVCLACILMFVIRFFRRKALLLEHELRHIARHDALTGLCNRRYLSELAEREVELAKRHASPLATLMLDIDHFKNVNDSYGHDVGDLVIKALADTCTRSLRRIDHIGRIGGEEFVCILPSTSREEAIAAAERMRRDIELVCVGTPKGEIRFTVSIGVALFNPAHADWPTLLKDADVALYRAKHEGRNRVVVAEPDAAGSAAQT